MGEAIGPVIGGSVTRYYNFDYACYFTSTITFFASFLFLFFNLNEINEEIEMKGELEKEKEYVEMEYFETRTAPHTHESIDKYPHMGLTKAFSMSSLNSH